MHKVSNEPPRKRHNQADANSMVESSGIPTADAGRHTADDAMDVDSDDEIILLTGEDAEKAEDAFQAQLLAHDEKIRLALDFEEDREEEQMVIQDIWGDIQSFRCWKIEAERRTAAALAKMASSTPSSSSTEGYRAA